MSVRAGTGPQVTFAHDWHTCSAIAGMPRRVPGVSSSTPGGASASTPGGLSRAPGRPTMLIGVAPPWMVVWASPNPHHAFRPGSGQRGARGSELRSMPSAPGRTRTCDPRLRRPRNRDIVPRRSGRPGAATSLTVRHCGRSHRKGSRRLSSPGGGQSGVYLASTCAPAPRLWNKRAERQVDAAQGVRRRRRYRAMAAARTTGRGRFVTLLRVPRAPLAASTRDGGGP